MSMRTVAGTLALISAGAYAVHYHWDTISEELGLDQYSPSEIKAIDLAKSDFHIERYRNNSTMISERMRSLEGVKVKGWKAEQKTDVLYLVTFTFNHNDQQDGYYFEVHLGSGTVKNVRGDEELEAKYGIPAAPN